LRGFPGLRPGHVDDAGPGKRCFASHGDQYSTCILKTSPAATEIAATSLLHRYDPFDVGFPFGNG
jgi:hypothetical protein